MEDDFIDIYDSYVFISCKSVCVWTNYIVCRCVWTNYIVCRLFLWCVIWHSSTMLHWCFHVHFVSDFHWPTPLNKLFIIYWCHLFHWCAYWPPITRAPMPLPVLHKTQNCGIRFWNTWISLFQNQSFHLLTWISRCWRRKTIQNSII